MTLTIEELKYGAEVGDLGIDAVRAVCAEALANREAQPVEIGKRSVFTCSSCGAQGLDEPLESRCHCMGDGAHWAESALYTAPPAPAVPDIKIQKAILWLDGVIQSNPGMKEAVTCRAAMLAQPVSHGYKLNSPVIPDGWIACSERMPTPFVDVIASDGKQTICAHVIEDRWWCIVSETAEEPGPIIFWMPLPAAPEGGK